MRRRALVCQIGFGPSDRYDATGYTYGDDLVSATEEGKLISYVLFSPETDKEECKYTWIVLHDCLYFGSGFYKGQDKSGQYGIPARSRTGFTNLLRVGTRTGPCYTPH